MKPLFLEVSLLMDSRLFLLACLVLLLSLSSMLLTYFAGLGIKTSITLVSLKPAVNASTSFFQWIPT